MFKRIVLILLFLALIVAGWFLWRVAPVANGYAAKYLCSLTFTSGLDPEQGHQHYIKPMHFLFRLVKPEIHVDRKEVTATFFGFFRPRTAVWRDGCGCTLLVKRTAEDLLQQHQAPTPLPSPDSIMTGQRLWPEGEDVNRDSLSTTVNWQMVDSLLDDFMLEKTDDPKQRNNTHALVIAWRGRIIGERYAEGVDLHTPLPGWSMAKSITGSLTGVMVQQHQLDIHAPVGYQEWMGDVRKDITINHLLRMESGLDFEENYAPLADATEMLYGSSDMGLFARSQPPAVAPGTRWSYSSGTSNILADLLYHHMGQSPEAMHRLAYDEFFHKLGITSAIFEHDESDAFVGSSYLYMSARDWLRVCKLYMDKGVWNGEPIFPKGWVQYALHPTPNAPNACYGAHIWLNAAEASEDRRLPSLPQDAFMFRGFQGQWVVGIPSMDIMVARLGVSHDDNGSPGDLVASIFQHLHPDK